MIIYKCTNLLNGKIYIGQTTNPLWYRADQHFRETRSVKKNTYFHNAINKYGAENFHFEQIDDADTIEDLNKKEQYWIQFYHSNDKKIGYNLDSGGSNCLKSDSTKEKIGAIKKENWKNPVLREKMKNGLEKATQTWIDSCPRETGKFLCMGCGKEVTLVLWESKKRKYCSQECFINSTKDSLLENIKIATLVNIERTIEKRENIKRDVLDWSIKNKQIIINCPFNDINSVFKPLIEIINLKFSTKDPRSISQATMGNGSSRKAFLIFLKTYVTNYENIC